MNKAFFFFGTSEYLRKLKYKRKSTAILQVIFSLLLLTFGIVVIVFNYKIKTLDEKMVAMVQEVQQFRDVNVQFRQAKFGTPPNTNILRNIPFDAQPLMAPTFKQGQSIEITANETGSEYHPFVPKILMPMLKDTFSFLFDVPISRIFTSYEDFNKRAGAPFKIINDTLIMNTDITDIHGKLTLAIRNSEVYFTKNALDQTGNFKYTLSYTDTTFRIIDEYGIVALGLKFYNNAIMCNRYIADGTFVYLMGYGFTQVAHTAAASPADIKRMQEIMHNSFFSTILNRNKDRKAF